MHRFPALCLALLALMALAGCGNQLNGQGLDDRDPVADDRGDGDTGEGDTGGDNTGGDNTGGGDNGGGDNGGGGGSEPVPMGGACSCDAECAGTSANPGVCVFGVCMQSASGACASAGSSAECGAGSRCWNLSDGDPICWPDCDASSCAGDCDADGSCAPSDATSGACDSLCSERCTAGGGGGGDGCPPNSSLDGDSCYCDEGYVVNGDGTGCEPGSSGGDSGCPPNSYLSGDSCYCNEGYVVNDAGTGCVRECETNAECTGGMVCSSNFECVAPPCTPGSCESGFICSDSGSCVMDVGSPPSGAPVSCSDIPSWECNGNEAYCGALTTFNPRDGDGYWDYPLNGETLNDQYRSYARRDLVQLIKYASASVRCLGSTWTTGNGGKLGLGDMSEANGDIPGTSDGQPGHPQGTHVDGHDMDIAYFQAGTADNKLRSVCPHTQGGSDAYHCTGEPTMLDVWRTAAFIAKLHDSPQLRVIGVDGRVGPMVESAIDQLCVSGWLTGAACTSNLELAYETVDNGAGWYHFHHHHLHVSLLSRPAAGLGNAVVLPPRGKDACITLDCARPALDVDPRRLLYRPLKTRVVQ